jgi:hypothetical protein
VNGGYKWGGIAARDVCTVRGDTGAGEVGDPRVWTAFDHPARSPCDIRIS